MDLVGGLRCLCWGDYFSESGMLRVEVFPELCGGEVECVLDHGKSKVSKAWI
jgi:hypothetical protein